MIATITVGSVCAGNNHVHLNVTINGVTRTVTMSRADFSIEPSLEDAKELLAILIRSRVKAAGATTNNQIRNAIESAPFHI
jgi:hypothetical protein